MFCSRIPIKKRFLPSVLVSMILLSMNLASGVAVALPPSNPEYQPGFPVTLSGDFVRSASPALGDVNGDGIADVVVGGSDGMLYAYTGLGVLLWEVDTGNASIEGKAAIGDIDLDGRAEIIVGVGSTFTPNARGRLFIFDHNGVEQCHFDPFDVIPGGGPDGIYSSPALADLDGNDGGALEIVFGAWDERIRALHHDCTLLWERRVYDSIWSSPAIADLNLDGQLDVVIGADSHSAPPPVDTTDGGRLFAVNGATGIDLPGFPIQIDEVIVSSPAVGDIDGDGWPDIVVGTGNCWGAGNGCGVPTHPGVGEYLNGWDRFGEPLAGWPRAIPGQTTDASPTLVDLDRDGRLEVVINTLDRESGTAQGFIYVLLGDGRNYPGWPVQPSTPGGCDGETVHFGTHASPIAVDLVGDKDLEIALPSNGDIVIWDRNANQLSRDMLVAPGCAPPNPDALILNASGTVNGSAAVGDIDGNGDLEVVAAGYAQFGEQQGAIWAWDFSSPSSAGAPWPTFRQGPESRADAFSVFREGFENGTLSRWTSASP